MAAMFDQMADESSDDDDDGDLVMAAPKQKEPTTGDLDLFSMDPTPSENKTPPSESVKSKAPPDPTKAGALDIFGDVSSPSQSNDTPKADTNKKRDDDPFGLLDLP